MNIVLKSIFGKQWRSFKQGYIRGFAFVENNLLQDEDLYRYLYHAYKNDRLDESLYHLNGSFSAILFDGDLTIMVSDKLRTYPLFYFRSGKNYTITDLGDVVLENLSAASFSSLAEKEYLAIGYLSGNKTLVEGCKEVPAATYVIINDLDIREIRYYSLHTLDFSKTDKIDTAVNDIIERVMMRMKQIVGNRKILIPLSGGYDSRLIACLCKKYDFRNVTCFTYGIKQNPEIAVSRSVAKELGFQWYYVEYDEPKWKSIINSTLFQSYMRYAGNLNTTPHMQDFLAIHELLSNQLIDDTFVVVPGHTGDVIGGSHLPYNITPKNIANRIIDKYGETHILKKKYEKELITYIDETISNHSHISNREECLQAFHNWNIFNRQSHFIVNSVRVYEFQHLDWYLPLWDDEFANFWNSIPCSLRVGSKLYDDYLFENYFIPMNVPYRKIVPSRSMIKASISARHKFLIKRFLLKLGLYTFPEDEYALDILGRIIKGRFPLENSKYIYCSRDTSMCVKSLYYLSLVHEKFKLGH